MGKMCTVGFVPYNKRLRVGMHPVYAGTGTVWENRTHSIPMWNPTKTVPVAVWLHVQVVRIRVQCGKS